MRKVFAEIVSVVLQPLVIPSLVYWLVLFVVPEASSIPEPFKGRVFWLIALSTLIIPMLTIFGLRLSGTLKSIHMAELKDRAIPFSVTCIYYYLTVYFLYQRSELDPILWQVLGLITLAITGLTLVTFFWKMSAHMTGMGGLIAAVVVLASKFPTFSGLYPLIISLLLTGLVGTVRLYLNAHKPIETYVGLVFGFLVCYIGFNLIWL
ncbi:PA-phosphatase [Algoriphagus halophytocola]|uniref:PA-phosphatase n=1 Tax=Algoriphagus halophytocola TaxID=2991499 RepID=UPI0022DE955E|nr:PA-phosphatase [Algoriphagus sp. TR-M9]WBL41820.1 PA-phosphatase [Algoriphagus sp. TR-M9]